MNRNEKLKKIGGGFIRLIIANIACFMILLVYMFIYGKGVIVSFLTGLCTAGVVCGLLADYCLKFSEKVKSDVKYRGKDPDANFGLTMGLVLMIPGLITATVALLAYLNVIPRNYCAIYYIFNTYFVPLVDIPIHGFIGNPYKYNVWAIVIMYLVQLLIPFTTFITYKIGYNGVDVGEKIMYKGKDE
ncbi:MAG: hypothetical protein GX896_08155 [Clostridiales bacterium]|nr:hypothetical protein [Clostridiales bacterium]